MTKNLKTKNKSHFCDQKHVFNIFLCNPGKTKLFFGFERTDFFLLQNRKNYIVTGSRRRVLLQPAAWWRLGQPAMWPVVQHRQWGDLTKCQFNCQWGDLTTHCQWGDLTISIVNDLIWHHLALSMRWSDKKCQFNCQMLSIGTEMIWQCRGLQPQCSSFSYQIIILLLYNHYHHHPGSSIKTRPELNGSAC